MSTTSTPNKAQRGRKRAHSPAPPATPSAVSKQDKSSVASSAADAAALPEVTISPPNKKQKVKKESATASERSAQAAQEYDARTAPVYDNCNEVRRKIRAHMSKGVKITEFLREIGNIAHNSYQQFMRMKGPIQGAGNCVYPAAYHFFERQRIAEGKPKSKSRLLSESISPQGCDTNRSATKSWYIATPLFKRRGPSFKPDPAFRRQFLKELRAM